MSLSPSPLLNVLQLFLGERWCSQEHLLDTACFLLSPTVCFFPWAQVTLLGTNTCVMGPSVHRPLAHWHSCSFVSSHKGLCDMQRSFFPPWSLRSTCKVLEAGQSTCWLIMSQSFKWKQTPCYTRTDLSPLMSQAQGSSQPCLLAFAFHQHAPLQEGVYVLCVNPLPLGCPSPTIVLDILRQCWILGKVVMVIFIFGSSSFVLFSS